MYQETPLHNLFTWGPVRMMALPDSCDMFIAMPSVTAKGAVIVGKNSDRPAGEVQEVIFQASIDHSAGEKLQCTYIEIDEVAHTHGVILSKPAWMWGAEMGANDQGVVIGNEAVWTKEGGPGDAEERLLGMDLVRLGLERAATAEEAVQVIVGLLNVHGQGGPCYEDAGKLDVVYHNSFMVADASVAYILDTAGQHWAVEKVKNGVRNISNFLTVGTNIDKCSDGLKEYAQSKGFWDGSGDFDFATSFTSPPAIYGQGTEHPENRFKSGKEMLEKLSSEGDFSATSMMEILRNEEGGICRVGRTGSATTGSMVCVLYPPSSGKLSTHWFTATPNPKCSVFKPFVFTPDIIFTSHTTSPKFDSDPAKTKPRFQSEVSREHALYKAHALHVKPLPGDDANQSILSTVKLLESSCIAELGTFIEESDQSRSAELNELFKDAVESEMKFYHVKKTVRK